MPTGSHRVSLPQPSAGKIQRFPNNLGQWLLELRSFVPSALRLLDAGLLPELDLRSLTRVPRTLLPTDLRHRENDGLFTATALGAENLALLLYEFKSYPDPATFIQALQYLVPFWARQTPPLHPGDPQEVRLAAPGVYILYTGEQPWDQARSLEEAFVGPPTILAGERPSLGRVRMLELHRFPAARLEADGSPLALALRLLQAEAAPWEEYQAVAHRVRVGLDRCMVTERADAWRVTWVGVLHLSHSRTVREYNQLLPEWLDWAQSHFGRRTETMADSMAHHWQQLGEQRGEERGRSKQAREMLLAVLRTRFGEVPAEVRSLVEKQDVPWCEAAVARMATAASLEDLRRAGGS